LIADEDRHPVVSRQEQTLFEGADVADNRIAARAAAP
jgi:hypothetical protein